MKLTVDTECKIDVDFCSFLAMTHVSDLIPNCQIKDIYIYTGQVSGAS